MTAKTRVSIRRCEGYDDNELDEAFVRALHDIGFDSGRFRGARVALKPNLLNASAPDKAVVTNPAFFAAAVRIVKAHGGTPVLVESPAFQSLERVAAKTGYDAIIAAERLEVFDNRSVAVIMNDEARRFKRFEVARPLLEADILFNLPKLKTHAITRLTCAVKNLFGTIPGLAKSRWHMRAGTGDEFPELILDLYGALSAIFSGKRSMLHLVDGIMGMEGDGPGPSGTPRKIGVVLAGTDAVAVDSVAAGLIGLDSANIANISSAAARGLGVGRMEDIEIKGVELLDIAVRDFKVPASRLSSRLRDYVLKMDALRNLWVEKPLPSPDRCTLCYQCRTICPAEAIGTAEDGASVPKYDYTACIRCYCCMEICPEAAIRLEKGKLQRIMDWF